MAKGLLGVPTTGPPPGLLAQYCLLPSLLTPAEISQKSLWLRHMLPGLAKVCFNQLPSSQTQFPPRPSSGSGAKMPCGVGVCDISGSPALALS